ncbi:mRNA capping enzyme-domain-containing protein [Aspergillus ambiguus]|uniref:mRNA capping enzyme-domain-containing protein n=1 Tax=Aspergillus ambiguus TaxID=176160 RepID=UPI003CCCE04E
MTDATHTEDPPRAGPTEPSHENTSPADKPAPTPASDNPLPKRRRMEERHQKSRRRGRTPPSAYSRRDGDEPSTTPNRADDSAKRSLSPVPPPRSPTPEAQARKRKRPGGGARMGLVDRETLRRRQEERERAQEQDALRFSASRGVTDVVRQHYNAVPQRGREWRKTESKIKGLRSFNNWVKSTLIQKFSPDEEFVARFNDTKEWADGAAPPQVMAEEKKLLVLDLGCGKGGDLGKWQLAPQPVDLYVGLDPAEISVVQARERYSGMRSGRGPRGGGGRRPRLFHAEFAPKDCFGEWLGDIEIIQQVGIDPNAGPGGSVMSSRWGGGGFDVVTSMFAIHYAFESEEKARQMLRNVAGCLKKGGRFIGVCPNSDIITARVAEMNAKRKEHEATAKKEDAEPEDGEVEEETKTEWGNSIYRVRFPGETPEDGVFRPPFGWRYSYFMEEAVEEIPEYVVPWEAFRALTEDYNLELQYRRPFLDIWEDEKDDPDLGPLSERMGVRDRNTGALLMTEEEKEAVATSSRARSNTPPLPPYEPPLAPLHTTGHAKLVTLLKSQSLRQLKTHLQHAEEKLTDSAGEVNERLTDSRVRYEKQKERRRNRRPQAQGDGDGDDGEQAESAAALDDAGDAAADTSEEHERLMQLEEQVTTVTGELEKAMRRTIDAEVKADALAEVMGRFETEAEQASVAPRRARRRLRRHMDAEEEDEGEDDEDADYDPGPEHDERDAPSQKLDGSLLASYGRWDGLSLTERYSTNNAYVGFYRIIHEAQHPGDDIPPLPHASTWFTHLEDSTAAPADERHRTRGTTRRGQRNRSASPADSDDIAIERERISLKCPLTLLPFRDPVTSTKCPHSFEREAIEGMLATSGTTVPAPPGSRTRRVRSVKCPVCSEALTADDLRSDPVLLRRVRRAEAAMRREAEDDELDAEGGRQRRRKSHGGIVLGSDDVAEGDFARRGAPDPVRVKQERFMSTPAER